jgi:hypothetical protein
MIEVPEGFRVKLIRDYTRYHRDLKVGIEGSAVVPVGRAALSKNQFVSIKFVLDKQVEKSKGKTTTYEENIEVEVLRCDVEVIDERWRKWQGRESKEREDALASHVSKATIYTTRRGGFVELVVQYSNGRLNDTWKKKHECKQIVADLEKRGLLEEAIRGQGD